MKIIASGRRTGKTTALCRAMILNDKLGVLVHSHSAQRDFYDCLIHIVGTRFPAIPNIMKRVVTRFEDFCGTGVRDIAIDEIELCHLHRGTALVAITTSEPIITDVRRSFYAQDLRHE